MNVALKWFGSRETGPTGLACKLHSKTENQNEKKNYTQGCKKQ